VPAGCLKRDAGNGFAVDHRQTDTSAQNTYGLFRKEKLTKRRRAKEPYTHSKSEGGARVNCPNGEGRLSLTRVMGV